MLSLLHFLHCTVFLLHSAKLPLCLSISKHLLTAHVLSLEGPEVFLFFLGLSKHLVVVYLEGTFVHDGGLLFWSQSLEVIGLYSVSSKHGLLSSGVFCHEIVGKSEINFFSCSCLMLILFGGVSVSLFLCQLSVGFNN